MKNIKEFVVPTVTLFVICLVAALLLAFTNQVTAPKIEALAAETQQKAMQQVMPNAVKFGESAEDAATGCTYSEAYAADGSVVGYAVTAVGKGGYGGEIKLMVGVTPDGSVADISFLEMNETASIGMKLKDDENFLNQLIGLTGSAALTKNGGTVDAVTGATKTSAGITDAVNNALLCYNALKGEVSNNG